MKVKQIATILNTVINPEQIGETAVVNEDLSNIVDVGKALTAAGKSGVTRRKIALISVSGLVMIS